jgi:fatty-acyl-CoA synthase
MISYLETDWCAKWAKYSPSKFFLREYSTGLEWNFSDFNNRANALANYFNYELNLKKGDRIAVYSKNRAEFILLFIACVKAGTILVPLNFRLTPRELDTLIYDAEPSLFLYEKDFEKEVARIDSLNKSPKKIEIDSIRYFLTDEIPKTKKQFSLQISFDDPVMILYTAGTTGLSKGVIITHKQLFWNAVNTGLRLNLTENDHTQSYAPFFHTGGWNVLFTPFLFFGASHTILNSFDSGLILDLMEKEKATVLFGVPTMLQMMSDSEKFASANLGSVRFAIVGGAPMPIPLINIWHKKGIYIRQGFGLTEVGPNCFSLHQDDAIRKKGSIGFPNFYIDAKIVDEEGNEQPDGTPGELWLRSPVVTAGYWRKPKETASAITDGWFHTGDILIKDEDGYFFVVDRKKNMYISGGENVYPSEVEKYLYTHEAIKECAVIGVADERWGETGKAFVVLNSSYSILKDEIISFCKAGLAKYKIPKQIEFLPALPKNEAGKINRQELIKIHNQQTHTLI